MTKPAICVSTKVLCVGVDEVPHLQDGAEDIDITVFVLAPGRGGARKKAAARN